MSGPIYLYLSAHGETVVEDGDIVTSVVPPNITLMLPAYCGSTLSITNLDPKLFYKSSYTDKQFVRNLENGLLPVLSNTKKRVTSDREISQFDMLTFKPGEEYADTYISFDPNYKDKHPNKIMTYFKSGVFILPLIDDTPTECDHNKRNFFYRPDNCNCRDIRCEFDVDSNNNMLLEDKFMADFNVLDLEHKPEEIVRWTKKYSIFTDSELLANGGVLDQDGFPRIKLSEILVMLINRWPDRQIILISATCRSFSTDIKNDFLDLMANKSEHTDKYDKYIYHLTHIILDFIKGISTDTRPTASRREINVICRNLAQFLVHGDVNVALYWIDQFESYLCRNKWLFQTANYRKLDMAILDFNEVLTADVFNGRNVTKPYSRKTKSDTDYFKFRC
jgi:hypothetical protein